MNVFPNYVTVYMHVDSSVCMCVCLYVCAYKIWGCVYLILSPFPVIPANIYCMLTMCQVLQEASKLFQQSEVVLLSLQSH